MHLDLAKLEDLKNCQSITIYNEYIGNFIGHLNSGGTVELIRIDDRTMEIFVYSVIYNIHDFIVFVRLFSPEN
jgi:hypothetical protein